MNDYICTLTKKECPLADAFSAELAQHYCAEHCPVDLYEPGNKGNKVDDWCAYCVSRLEAENIVGKRLQIARLERGMSLERLAELTGLPQETLEKYEKGTVKSPAAKKLALLAKALSCTVEYLKGETNYFNPLPEPTAEYLAAEDAATTAAAEYFLHYKAGGINPPPPEGVPPLPKDEAARKAAEEAAKAAEEKQAASAEAAAQKAAEQGGDAPELLDLYGKMSPEQKKNLLETARLFAGEPKDEEKSE